MMKTIRMVSVSVILALGTARASGAEPLQRYALVVGANAGGGERVRLQYAIADAERFARVMIELGGVAPGNAILLRQPQLRDLTDALDTLTRRAAESRKTARTEVIVYYSGHADEQGLLLGGNRYSYRTLRDQLNQIPADVRIAVLDACSSGAFTRIKSGKPRPAFLVDESSTMRGHAFLTSSSESEAAQESDRIRASYFTHYLISGFRGAADLSGDGKVTLNEAYQFAFNETLGRTVDTRGGAQHPSYDISMSGTGDVVMTDVRQTTATLVLGEDLEGRFFVRNAAQELIVELFKPRGRRVELAVEPGAYEVRVEREKGSLVARTDVTNDGRVVLDAKQFGVGPAPEPTRLRGTAEGEGPGSGNAARPKFAVTGRNRLELTFGTWQVHDGGTVVSTGNALDAMGGIVYTRYVSEELAVTFSIFGASFETGSSVTTTSFSAGTVTGASTLLGVRWNPLRGEFARQPIKPFVTAGLGPFFGNESGSFVTRNTISSGNTTRATLGGNFGGGVDVHVARSFSLGLDVGYNVMADFSQPIGVHDNLNGLQVRIGLGWLFGKGY